MRKTLSVVILIFMVFHNSFSQSCGQICEWPKVFIQGGTLNCSAYEVALFDDFNGESLDLSTWQTIFGHENHGSARIHHPCEEQLYFDENVKVENGVCKLMGFFDPGRTWTSSDENPTLYTRDITSGMIMLTESDLIGQFRFAYYEAKLKLPGYGWWPAFWMWHHDEIDIMENFWDDNYFQYNLYGSDECPKGNKFYTNINDGNFHTYAAELTPFSLTFYFDGNPLPVKHYRFYNIDGSPLIVDCEQNNVIPSGNYYLNPAFPQSRSRGFRPIVNLAVLPKYGCVCPQLGCDEPFCWVCGELGNENCNWGYPIDENCNIIGDVPATLEIDFIRFRERQLGFCNSLLIYGSNCRENISSGQLVHKEPLICESYCLGETANLYLEDLNSNVDNWLSQVTVINVTSSSDISILNFDNYTIKFKQNTNGLGEIYINFIDGCGQPSNVIYKLVSPDSGEIDFEIREMNSCIGNAELYFKSGSCNFEILNINVKSRSGVETPVDFHVDNSNIFIDFSGHYFLTDIVIYFKNKCTGVVEDILIPLSPCGCCPEYEGFYFDSRNCYSGFTFFGVEGFIWGNAFFTTTNCRLYSENNCCPPGTRFNGVYCVYGLVPSGYTGFILENTFYVEPNCENCCPPGAVYNGRDCDFGIRFEGVEGFVLNNRFYTNQNCLQYSGNNCCPPGSIFDGNLCDFGIQYGDNFHGYVANNGFYTNSIHCLEDEGEKSVQNLNGSNFSTINNLSASGNAVHSVTIYPNPFMDELIIECLSDMSNIEKILIKTLEGKIIYEISQTEIKQKNVITAIRNSGVYIICVLTKSNLESYKVINVK